MPDQSGPLDVQQLILAQLREITAEVRLIPQILARLDSLGADQKRLEQRDDTLQRQIEDNKVRVSELVASLSILNNEVRDARRQHDNCPALKDAELVRQQIHSTMDTLSLYSVRVRKLEDSTSAAEMREELEHYENELHEWRPWLKGIKWAAGIAGGALVLVIVGAIIWAIVQSGAGLP